MGSEESKPKTVWHDGTAPVNNPKRTLMRTRSVCADPEGSYALIRNDYTEVFRFDPEQTFMVAYAIDDQTSPRFSHRKLSGATLVDARQVCLAFVDKGVLPEHNARLFAASRHPDVCTAAGMRQSFTEIVQRVGDRGLFIFHFSGHGLKIGKDKEWGLAPADFDYTDATFVTSAVLNQWLHEAGCRAAHVLFVLDCCYSGGLAQELTAHDIYLHPGLYVLSACTAFETSLVIGPLGHSIFAYFLAYALRTSKFGVGTLPIEAVFEECGALSTALSSLLVSYSPGTGLRMNRMNPELHFFEPLVESAGWALMGDSIDFAEQGDPSSFVDLNPTIRSFDYVLKYYRSYSKRGLRRREVCEACYKWLVKMTDSSEFSPLSSLGRRGLLQVSEVLRATICCIMWSMASIGMEHDKKHVNDPNVFLVGFLYAAAELKKFNTPHLNLGHLKESLEFYEAVLEVNKVDHLEVKLLLAKVTKDQVVGATISLPPSSYYPLSSPLSSPLASPLTSPLSSPLASPLTSPLSFSPTPTLTAMPTSPLSFSPTATLTAMPTSTLTAIVEETNSLELQQQQQQQQQQEEGEQEEEVEPIPENAPELQSIVSRWWVPLSGSAPR